MKQVSANASSGATIDQASDHHPQTKATRDPFELNITEDPPTTDQVQTILEYVGKSNIPSVIKGARDEKDALKKFKESQESLQRPLVSITRIDTGSWKPPLTRQTDGGLESGQGYCR